MTLNNIVAMADAKTRSMELILQHTANARDTSCPWSFTYQQFVREPEGILAEPEPPTDLALHPGPAIDLADKTKSTEQRQKKGR